MAQEAPEAPEAPKAEETTTEVKVEETKTFDADYVKSLRNENARYRTEAQEVKTRLQELEERDASELEKAQKKAARAEQQAAEAASRLTRYEVAAEKNVPAEAVDFLKGNTREELEASADKLLELVKSRSESNSEPNFDGGAREPASDPKTPEQAHNETVLALMGISPT